MLWIDIKYANLLSFKLDKFKVKNNNPYTATFRCPLCGDSAKNKNKTRGFFFIQYNKLRMKCHNCGESFSFKNFLKKLDKNLFDQYNLESFGISNTEPIVPETTKKLNEPVKMTILNQILDPVNSLDENHPARVYCNSRKLPDSALNQIFYIDDVSLIGQLKESYKEKIKGKESRIVLPFYNRKGVLVGVTMRALDDHPLRYIAIRLNTDEPMIFNYDQVDFTKQVYCVEGPFDSFFLPNCVAVGGSDMKTVRKLLPENTIYVFDNQPRNSEIIKLIRAQILSGFRVCIFPDKNEYKDLNDMVLAGLDVESIIYTNSYQGLEAQLKFEKWRKL